MGLFGTSYEVLEGPRLSKRESQVEQAERLFSEFERTPVADWLEWMAREGRVLRMIRVAHVLGRDKWGVEEEDRESDWWMARAIFNVAVERGDVTGGPQIACGLWCDEFYEFWGAWLDD